MWRGTVDAGDERQRSQGKNVFSVFFVGFVFISLLISEFYAKFLSVVNIL